MNFRALPAGLGSKRGSALITTLLIIVVLTIIVTAFLQSMTIEQQTSRSYLNRYRAEVAARAGLQDLISRISPSNGVTNFHYAVIENSANRGTEKAGAELQLLAFNSELPSGTPIPLYTAITKDSAKIQIVPKKDDDPAFGVDREVGLVDLPDEDGVVRERYGFWTDPADFRQNIALGGAEPRKATEYLSQIPLFGRKGDPWSDGQVEQLKGNRSLLFTTKTANQLAQDLPTPATDYDYTRSSRSTALTPEGWPKLNLRRLKVYIDGGTFWEDRDGDGKYETEAANYGGLSKTQGPDQNTNKRFELVTRLLNENGNYPFNKENPWGPGNLEIILKNYPELDAAGNPTQARQIVANIIDYIDEDIIPTTDGSPGTSTSSADSNASGGSTANLATQVFTTFPAAPTFLGVEGRIESSKVRGHPFINMLSQGLIFNSSVNSTRLLGDVGIVNPWEGSIPWDKGGYYQVEMQVELTGTAVGTRGAKMQGTPGTNTGYFRSAWLAQNSGITRYYKSRSLQGYEGRIFPRGWTGEAGRSDDDLANGFYTINQDNLTLRDLGAKIQIARIIYYDGSGTTSRYLVQDVSAVNVPNLERKWSNSNWIKPSGNWKIGSGSSGQKDWYLRTDPRLNFQGATGQPEKNWVIDSTKSMASTLTPPPGPSTPIKIYSSPESPSDATKRDDPQGITDNYDWYKNTIVNHFPTYAQGYQPSPELGAPAMRSYAEFGFIHTGRPWQTLRLYSTLNTEETVRPENDLKLIDYIDLGYPNRAPEDLAFQTIEKQVLLQSNRKDDLFGNRETNGAININTDRLSAAAALMGDTEKTTDSHALSLANIALNSASKPFLKQSDIFLTQDFMALSTLDFEKEKFVSQIAAASTVTSKEFTVYVLGESLKNDGSPASRVTLKADIILETVSVGGTPTIRPKVLGLSFL